MIDLLITGGSIHDGSGGQPYQGHVAVVGDRIVAVIRGEDTPAALTVINAAGMAVCPGFVNVLSHSYLTILHDPRSLGELTQGVTTQIFGEGESMGPLTPAMADLLQKNGGGLEYGVEWQRLSEYLAHAEHRGVSQNVASFIGATTLRINAVGYDDRPATAAEIDHMQALVREEMDDGALGIGSSLIYPPAFFASTEELIALCRPAAERGGMYISHMRSEGARLLESIDELIRISLEGGLPAEIWHLKAAGRDNWPKMEQAIDRVEQARSDGLAISADVYPYTAGATGLASSIPPWFHDGGTPKLFERLADPSVRAEIRAAIEAPGDDWENLYRAAGGGDGVLVMGVRQEENRRFQGKTLTQIADMTGSDPVEALMDLVLVDRSRVSTAYFMISEDNLRRQLAMPWVSVGSDAASMATEGVFLNWSSHPRSYGTFARVLGHYARDEGVITVAEAVRRMSSLPAETLGLADRGRITDGSFADIVVFDPSTVIDRATFDDPHQYATGVRDVVVNGQVTLRNGEFAGRFAGRALKRVRSG